MLVKVWNFVQFQAGWFALVLSAAQGHAHIGVLVMAVLALLHLALFARPNESRFFIVVMVLGWLWETAFYHAGLIVYSDSMPQWLFAPFWMAMLWLNFATVINHSLRWLQGRYYLAALMGAVGGPLAFWAGSSLGAASFPAPAISLAVIGLAWALLLPAVLLLAKRLVQTGPRIHLKRGCPGGLYADAQ